MAKKLMNRNEMPIGSVIDQPGNAKEYETGGWRNQRPIHDKTQCRNCLTCWIYCPEGCIKAVDGKIDSIDLKYCKGCGICAVECPFKEKGTPMRMIEEKKEE